MFKCTSKGGHDEGKPCDLRNCSNAWIPVLYVLCVLKDTDAVRKRSISSA